MTTAERLVRQFSCPQEAADERVFEAIVVAEGRQLATRLLDKYREPIETASEGLAEFIDTWTRVPATFDAVWDVAFGRVRHLLGSAKLDPLDVAVRLALRLTETGHHGTWRAWCPTLNGLRIGSFLLPPTEVVEASSDAAAISVDFRGHGRQGRLANPARDGKWWADGAERLAQFGTERPIYLLPSYALAGDDENHDHRFDDVRPSPMIDGGMVAAFADGFRIIEEHAAEYLLWIERVMRSVAVCILEQSFRAVSSSREGAPGLVDISYPLSAMDIAEILVHESSHQYFYLLERLGPVDDGTDLRKYWSPATRSERSLQRILIAYHAFANVWLFYQACRARGVGKNYLETNEPKIRKMMAELDVPLRGNRALSTLGRALYEPLAERIAEIGNA